MDKKNKDEDMSTKVKLANIEPNPIQPRKDFPEEGIRELADNIKQVGLKQPLIIRPLSTTGGKKYQLVDGERRYRACKLIPLQEVPVEIRQDIKTQQDAALESFIINEERSNYSSQDRDAYIFNLYQTSKLSTRKLAEKLGKHHSFVDHCIEAHRFRHKLPPTLVGTLELSSSALKNTASIKDDNLRIRMLQAIQEKKIKSSSEASEKSKVLKNAPKALYEAYFCDLIDWVTVVDLAGWVDEYGPDILGLYAKDIPLELRKDVIEQWPFIQAAIVPDLLKWLIKRETEDKNRYIELHIELNPHKDANHIRKYAEKQIKGWEKEYKASVKQALIDFRKKYQKDAEAAKGRMHADNFWIEVYYWIINSIMVMQQTKHLPKDDLDTRIAIVDMMYTNEILLALRSGLGQIEAIKRLENVRVPNDSSTKSPEELAADYEEAVSAKVKAEHAEIEKIMSPSESEEEEPEEYEEE